MFNVEYAYKIVNNLQAVLLIHANVQVLWCMYIKDALLNGLQEV